MRIPVGDLGVLGLGVKVEVEVEVEVGVLGRGGRTRAVYSMIWRGFSGRLMS